MKIFLSLILAVFAISFPLIAQETTSGSTTKTVKIEVQKKDNTTLPTLQRMPMRITIEAHLDVKNHRLDINYNGEEIGEVFLSLNGNIIAYDSEINTSFQISTPGLYEIEIVGETWLGFGYFQI